MAGHEEKVDLPDFGESAYWEEHYVKAAADGEEVYDWLVGWEQLQWLLEPLLARDVERQVLHLGNGNSPLPEEMFDAGYVQQTAVDISEAAMTHMEARNRGCRPSIVWKAADCRRLDIPSDSFPLVVDKSTLDAFFCHDQHALAIMEFVKEAFRVTAVGGALISVSMHRPKSVLPWLRHKAFAWNVTTIPIEDGQPSARARPRCHAYICGPKRCEAQKSLEVHWPRLYAQVTEHPDSDLSSSSASEDSDEARTYTRTSSTGEDEVVLAAEVWVPWAEQQRAAQFGLSKAFVSLDFAEEPKFATFRLAEGSLFFDQRLLISRSEYFRNMLASNHAQDWRESRTGQIDLRKEEKATCKSMSAILRFILTDSFSFEDLETAQMVRALADQFCLFSLVAKVDLELLSRLTTENVLELLEMTLDSGNQLEDACWKMLEADGELLEKQAEELEAMIAKNPKLGRKLVLFGLGRSRGSKRKA